MNKLLIAAGCVGLASVALGAFGAHGLEGKLSAEELAWWETATFYALPHAIAALAIALSGRRGLLGLGGWFLILGAVIFAATLYGMALGLPRWLGAITPIGGTSILIGWALVIITGFRRTD